ncbi:unnamed protein product [Blepharisma stoltei]|uniref:Peroxisome membrane anchor protein Pex14p N-terminal domain-containing protein n=1 Tax=Blepharisma stoltei TaxID=1481888 RepID=A0AAU9IN10_9CILI|nr:unnamed protein product [Blepharisma stoltei]
MNEKLIVTAVNFLKNPKVQSAPKEKQIEFLKKKGLNDEDIAEAYKRVESSSKTEMATSLAPSPTLATQVPSYSSLKTTTLGLDRRGLTVLPPLIGISHLRILVISNNEFVSIPKEINLLQDLEILNASHNKLKNDGIPDELFDLSSLSYLNLAHNELTSLERFGRFLRLEKLNVAYNSIEEIPDEICYMQELKYLWIQNNKLKKVTKYLGLMSSLRMALLLGNEDLPELLKNATTKNLHAILDTLK